MLPSMGRDSDSLMALTLSYSFHLVFLCVASQTRIQLVSRFCSRFSVTLLGFTGASIALHYIVSVVYNRVYDRDFMDSLNHDNQDDVIEAFNSTPFTAMTF